MQVTKNKVLLFTILGLLIPFFLYAQPSGKGISSVTEEDASPETFPWQIKFPNTSVTDNNDGTVSIDFGATGDITSVGDVTSGAAFDGTQGTTLTFNNAGGDGILLYNGEFSFDKNLGIGTTNPTQALDVSGTIAGTTITGANVTSGADPGHTHGSSSITEADPLAILTTGTRSLSGDWDNGDFDISTLGNIGIGNTNPLVLLDTTTSPSGGLKVLASGRVGIGTTAPGYELEVIGDISNTGDIYTGDNYQVVNNMGALGNLGVGTTDPTLKVDVRGAGTSVFGFTGGSMGIGNTAPQGMLDVSATTPGLGLIVTSGNRVGIGTTNPSQKLEIVGNLIVSGTGTFNILSITNPIDISGQTNLSGDTENVLTGDALSIGAAITRDTEWNGLDFLVGTATGTLSGEIVAGTAPGGSLGGTWASPTIDDLFLLNTGDIGGGTYTFTGNVSTLGNVGIGNTNPLVLLDTGTSPNAGLKVLASGYTGIGTTEPGATLHLRASNAGAVTDHSSAVLILEKGANPILQFQSANTQSAVGIVWGDPEDNDVGRIVYDHTTNKFSLWTAGSQNMVLDSSGNVGIGTTNPTGSFQVGTSPSAPILFVDGANVGIGKTAPAQKLDVAGLIKTTDTLPLSRLNILNVATGTIPGSTLSFTKQFTLDKMMAQNTGGTNAIFTLYGSPASGTGPYYNLSVGQTSTTSVLNVTSFTGGTVPANHLMLVDINSVSGTVPGMRLEVWGHE